MFNILISIDKLYTLMGYRMRSYVDCFSLWNFYKQCTSKEYHEYCIYFDGNKFNSFTIFKPKIGFLFELSNYDTHTSTSLD